MTGRELLFTAVANGPGGDRVDIRLAAGRVVEISPPGADPGGATVIAGRGGTVLPGLRDQHVHLAQWAASQRQLDVSSSASAVAAAELMAAAAPPDDPRELLSGFGFRDGLWPDAPHKQILQRVLPDRRVAVVSADLHSVWLSPAALAAIGLDHPTGLLREQQCWDARAALNDVPGSGAADGWAIDALHAAAARGVTSIQDFEFTDTITAWRRRHLDLGLPIRVRAAIFRPLLDESIDGGLRTGDPVPDTEGLVTVGPCKVLLDGSLNTRTAWCHQPYPGLTGDQANGLLTADPQELVATMKRAAAAGISFAVHAIGDRANTVALDCFAAAGTGGRIEHAQLVSAADLPRFADLGVIASVQPGHAPEDRDIADVHWSGRTTDAYPYAALAAAGAALEFGSDAPVSRLDPWYAIGCAIRRTVDERGPWHPEQALTFGQALAASTGGATALATGMPADLVLTATDPSTLDPEALPEIAVLATVVAGRLAHSTD